MDHRGPTPRNPIHPSTPPYPIHRTGFSLHGGFAGRQMASSPAAQQAARARAGQVMMRLFDQKRREIKFIEDIAGLRKSSLSWLLLVAR